MSDAARWPVRDMPASLARRYRDEGFWVDDTLGALVDRSLRAAPEAGIHIWSETVPWHGTYGQVHDEALRLLTVLREAGLKPGDVVAYQLPNWHEAVVTFYALTMGGFVLVPIVHIYGAKEVRFILQQSEARAYISADRFGHVDYLDIIDGGDDDDVASVVLHVVVGDPGTGSRPGIRRTGWDVVDAAAPIAAIAVPAPEAVCVLAYTSGTTSTPKGVMHNSQTLLSELAQMRARVAQGSLTLMGSPVAHATGMLGILLPIVEGDDIHLIDRWDPTRVLEIMLEAKVGAGVGASVFLTSLMEHPNFTPEHARLSRNIGLGGAPVPVEVGERATAHGITVTRAYGSTEHPSITGSTFTDPADKRHATDGSPLPGVEIKLLDDDGTPVAMGIAGEIWSRGPELCVGYTDPAVTEHAFDADGWYRTGDLGTLDADGFLTITDRLNDVIIRGGENISAAEIELAVAAMDQVAEVAVVAAPDARLGEHACAVVRLVPGASLELADVIARLEAVGLARQKWPEQLWVVDDFPRTATGKILKVDLRKQLRAQA